MEVFRHWGCGRVALFRTLPTAGGGPRSHSPGLEVSSGSCPEAGGQEGGFEKKAKGVRQELVRK